MSCLEVLFKAPDSTEKCRRAPFVSLNCTSELQPNICASALLTVIALCLGSVKPLTKLGSLTYLSQSGGEVGCDSHPIDRYSIFSLRRRAHKVDVMEGRAAHEPTRAASVCAEHSSRRYRRTVHKTTVRRNYVKLFFPMSIAIRSIELMGHDWAVRSSPPRTNKSIRSVLMAGVSQSPCSRFVG